MKRIPITLIPIFIFGCMHPTQKSFDLSLVGHICYTNVVWIDGITYTNSYIINDKVVRNTLSHRHKIDSQYENAFVQGYTEGVIKYDDRDLPVKFMNVKMAEAVVLVSIGEPFNMSFQINEPEASQFAQSIEMDFGTTPPDLIQESSNVVWKMWYLQKDTHAQGEYGKLFINNESIIGTHGDKIETPIGSFKWEDWYGRREGWLP